MSLSGGRSKTKSSQTGAQSVTSSTALTDWSKNQWEDQTKGILDTTTAYTSQPFKSYTNPMVAGLSENEQKARQMVTAGSGSGGILGDAVGAANAGGALSWTPESVQGPTEVNYREFDKNRVKDKYNVFEDEVVAANNTYADEQLASQLNQQRDEAARRGAFGNSSVELGEAELRRTSAMDRAKMQADMRYKGYTDAMGYDQSESDRLYGADVRNSDTGYQARLTDATRRDNAAQFGVQQKFQQAGILGSLAGQKNTEWQQQASMLAQMGATDRDIEQARLLAERAEFDREAKDQLDKLMLELQARSGILSSTPLMTTQTSSGNSSGTSTGSTSGMSFGMTFPGLDKFGIGVPGG